MKPHIIIAGAGPGGLLTALGLAQAGSRVTVLEAEPQLNDNPRALVYHYPVLPHLERMGLLEDCVADGFTRQDFGWHVYSTGEMIHWTLSCLDGHVPHPYALHLHQGQLSRVLARHLERQSSVDIRFSTRLTGCTRYADRVVVEVEGPGGLETLEGDFLIGADGANSVIRREVLGLEFLGVTWPERYVATNTRIDLARHGFPNCVMQLDKKHGAVICKIDASDYWRITFVEDPSLPIEELPARIDAMFVDHVPERDYEVVAFAPYRMHQRIADNMRVGRVLLVGDAGHITNPTGGLGLTGGMFDAFALIEALNRVLHEGAADDVLDFYGRDRRRVFAEITSPRASENLRLLYHTKEGEQKEEWIAWLRDVGRSNDRMRAEFGFTEQLGSRV